MMSNSSETIWKPASLFEDHSAPYFKYAFLILNQPILCYSSAVTSLWKRALLRTTVDGGTDHWLQFCEKYNIENRTPHLVTGDLDSVTPASLELFSALGARIVKTPNQDETDFTKALLQTKLWMDQQNVQLDGVVALVETAGRLDHILANLNTLFIARDFLPCPVYQLASNTLSWLLSPGKHRILVPEFLTRGHCSLVPLGEPCTRVTTTGLKWNLDNQSMQFGNLVSTSNAFSDSEVTVDTDTNLVWTMEVMQLERWRGLNPSKM